MLTVKHATELSSGHIKILVLHPARPDRGNQPTANLSFPQKALNI